MVLGMTINLCKAFCITANILKCRKSFPDSEIQITFRPHLVFYSVNKANLFLLDLKAIYFVTTLEVLHGKRVSVLSSRL